MSLGGLQNYTQPLSLFGDVTIRGDFNAKNVYVNGTLTGGGISTNILATNNTWSGTNNYTNTTSYTGSVPPDFNDDLTTKKDADDLAISYNSGALRPTINNNVWTNVTTWSNVSPPIIPTASGTPGSNKLVGYTEMTNYINNYPTIPASVSNTFTGNNQFTLSPELYNIPSMLIPTADDQLASKLYVDARLEVAGKTLTYTITNTGSYNFDFINRSLIVGIEFILFGGSYSGTHSGAMWSGKIGNANGAFNSLLLSVGIKDDPTNYTSYGSSVASNTTLKVGNEFVGIAGGACLLNGVAKEGTQINSANSITGTGGCDGSVGADNFFAYSNILGTLISSGGAILVAYYS